MRVSCSNSAYYSVLYYSERRRVTASAWKRFPLELRRLKLNVKREGLIRLCFFFIFWHLANKVFE